MGWLADRRCATKGHDWFPDMEAREFIPMMAKCLRCGEEKVTLPWGQCITNHPIAEHYDTEGRIVAHPSCGGPA